MLRQLLRARILAAREAGVTETQEGLIASWRCARASSSPATGSGAEFIREFQALTPPASPLASEIDQDMLGGGGLWLRAEPDEDRAQADALAAIVAIGIKA